MQELDAESSCGKKELELYNYKLDADCAANRLLVASTRIA